MDGAIKGALFERGLLSEDQAQAGVELVARVMAEGFETVRLLFADQHGILRGKAIAARTLGSALASGLSVPSTLILKDTAHRTVFDVWKDGLTLDGVSLAGAGDLLLVPDVATFTPLPWSPHSALILCDLAYRSGQHVSVSPRGVLRRAMEALARTGHDAVMGLEVEFQVFAIEDDGLSHDQATMPPAAITTRNTTQGWAFLTETRYGAVEPLLDEIRRAAEAMGLAPRSMEIEMGPSQFEFTFDASDPLTQADRFVLFRMMVKDICQRQGLHASFMPKPRVANAVANGWHIHQSLVSRQTGRNVFTPSVDGEPTAEAGAWIAGLLEHAPATCLLTNPTVNGYKRFSAFQLAPNRVQWGTDNRGAMLRALLYAGDPASRIENRVADTAANPYYALAGQILSGLDGLTRGATPPPPTLTPYAEDQASLPATLDAAIQAFEASPLYAQALGPDFVRYLAHLKRAEWGRYLATVSEWEQAEYFTLF
ncbi:glutamine synthetase family protein [Pararhodobacter aggregans]|uniref:Glutamine synthetase n=1 Tax=Pararhodobacter aggregans TaxID=404875 RepID=A0A2T7UK96_9RHOB|nr:glutamine synthetase family protein [Pararhodobacter aggregans]PTX03223.1 L-glutamine synthetase [Pararhodobacter aggregans]PVE45098.1 glutamine synthetase [Pararhodobacter aggregans]